MHDNEVVSAARPQARLPLLVEPEELERHLGDPAMLVVDLCRPESYTQYHIPGAVHLDYGQLVAARGPAKGLLPAQEALSAVFSSIGLTPDIHVVAYDDEGGGKAGRLIWTLDVVGHRFRSLLNGGIHAWLNEGHPASREPVQARPSEYAATILRDRVADLDYVRQRLEHAGTVIVDARSQNEYLGTTNSALRNGHIPGAVNLDWVLAIDPTRNLRLKPAAELRQLLESRGITQDKEIIVHCQTHHRSSHTYTVLKALGYEQVKAYPGSWSEWGNRTDTPVETGSG